MNATSLATFWAFVALVLFFVLIWYLKVPAKIAGALDGKVAEIENELAEAKRLRVEAQELLAAFEQKAADAEIEAQSIVAGAKAEAERLAEESTKALEELIVRRTRAAEAKIALAESQAVAEVRARAADVAVAAAEKLLAAQVAGVTGAELVAKGIAEVGAKLN